MPRCSNRAPARAMVRVDAKDQDAQRSVEVLGREWRDRQNGRDALHHVTGEAGSGRQRKGPSESATPTGIREGLAAPARAPTWPRLITSRTRARKTSASNGLGRNAAPGPRPPAATTSAGAPNMYTTPIAGRRACTG